MVSVRCPDTCDITAYESERCVTAGLGVEALGGDGINLVDEDDGRSVLLGQSEDVSYHPRALAQILLHKL